MSDASYLELCLRALPAEKQATARQAFHDLLEGAPDDSMLSRLLIVLEATAAYGRTIPAEITAAVQSGIAALDGRLAKLGNAAGASSGDVALLKSALTDHLSLLSEPLGQQRQLIESVRFAVEQVDRDVQRLRHARITAVLLLMGLAAIAGAFSVVAYFKPRYDAARGVSEAIEYLAQRGVEIGLADGGNNAVVVTISGPVTTKGTDWKADKKGRITGAQIVYP